MERLSLCQEDTMKKYYLKIQVHIYVKNATVFKGSSKTKQNELLNAMSDVYKTEIINQVKSSNFVALEADETTDSSNHQQLLIIIRYTYNGKVCERYWKFAKPEGYTADEIANVIIEELKHLITDNFKLIAQTYDEASVRQMLHIEIYSIWVAFFYILFTFFVTNTLLV